MIQPLQIVPVRIGGRAFQAHQSNRCLCFFLEELPAVRGMMPLTSGITSFRDEADLRHWFLWHWRKSYFARLLSWPQQANVISPLVGVNHQNFWLVDDRSGKSRCVSWQGDWPLGHDLWSEPQHELDSWAATQWPFPLEAALQEFLHDGRALPDEIEWKCGSWDELTRLFSWLLVLQPSLFEGEALELAIRSGQQPTFQLRKGTPWRRKSPITTHFKLWRVLPRLFLKWNHPLGNATLLFSPSPPTFHEQLEAKTLLRQWLQDKLTPSQIEGLLP